MGGSELYRLLTILFGLLGLALHVRALSVWDLKGRSEFIEVWATLPGTGKLVSLAWLAVPFAYYLFCLATSLSRSKSRHQTVGAAVIFALAIPFFFAIGEQSPTLSRNAAFTGAVWLAQYVGRPTRSRAGEIGVDSFEG
jgi:hypothetical protein